MAEYNIRFGYPQIKANPNGDPLPTQGAFHKSTAKFRLLAGGFGTGKTTSLVLEVAKQLMMYPKNYGVIGRKDLKELKSTTLKELLDMIPKELIKSHNKSEGVLTLYNESELYYMNLDDSREAVEKIKSLNLGFVAIDQLEEISEAVFLAFIGRLRRQDSARCFFGACNPAGHDWLWRRWKRNDIKNPEYELFEAITTENIYLPEDYVRNMIENYPKNWVNRFVYCSWEDFEGTVYSEFVEQKHKIPAYEPAEGEKLYIVLDYGFRNPTAILSAATDRDGITRIYDEYYESGKLIPELAEAVKIRDKQFTTKIADPSIKKRERDGFSVWDEFSDHGVYFEKANNVVIQGIDRVNQLFKNDKLFICENCTETLNEIGAYKWKQIRPGEEKNEHEEPTKKDDHAMDDLRYLANEIYTPLEPIIPEGVRIPEELMTAELSETTL